MTNENSRKDVPLKRVTLYKHGIGYFERRGSVDAPCRIELSCSPEDIDDMLKSLLVLKSGERISAVTYESSKPLNEKLAQFGFDLRSTDGFLHLLGQLKGVPVSVSFSKKKAVNGKVTGLDSTKKVYEGQICIDEHLVVFTEDRELKRIPVADIESIKITDEALAAELQQQLELLFLSVRKKDQKLLNVEIQDEEASDLTIAYSIPCPIWKTSYRLLFDEQSRLLLQGVAIVDNVQDEDWNEVEMTLVSAAPISFIQPLYEPVKPFRRTIQAQGVQSTGPFVAERAQRMRAKKAAPAPAAPAAIGAAPGMPMSMDVAMEPESTGSWDQSGGGLFGAPAQSRVGGYSGSIDELAEQSTGAEGESVGELFEYRIKDPVTVPRDSSALIPVVQQKIEGERVSLYKEERNRDFPYAAVKLENTTGLTLEAGPVTVMEADAYAGECLLDVLKPDDKRILPYALDQAVSVVFRDEAINKPYWKLRVHHGVLHLYQKNESVRTYNLENLSDKDKVIYVEHPVKHGWKLKEGLSPEEITKNHYRFRVELEGKQVDALKVIEEHEVVNQFSLINLHPTNPQVQWLLAQNYGDKELVEFLNEFVKRRQELVDLQNRIGTIQNDTAAQEKAQLRARENVKTLGGEGGRFKKAIEESEDKIIELQEKMKEVRKEEQEKTKELNEFIQKEMEIDLLAVTPV